MIKIKFFSDFETSEVCKKMFEKCCPLSSYHNYQFTTDEDIIF